MNNLHFNRFMSPLLDTVFHRFISLIINFSTTPVDDDVAFATTKLMGIFTTGNCMHMITKNIVIHDYEKDVPEITIFSETYST